ncbi:hypothetical protein [Cronobacter muytjensii]|uniref:hypothetical protein n=1 Tax=Cronobacter muytjensii TaxID=413501 RepID=UPI0003AA39B2|nr:hypothetical protein [Cronobacter muytjensii]ALB70718.1 hypothetical protein AFK63_08895 [Cronobacter muytjensii ATCC 51329]
MSAKNPTENAISELEMHWLDRTENSAARVIVWRVPASGECVLNGFFALQQHPEGRSLADLFLTLDTPFETGYGYTPNNRSGSRWSTRTRRRFCCSLTRPTRCR